MKTVLAYGDSLTWGMDARVLRRHMHEDQWPAALEARLNGAVRVINAGLGGRTTQFDDHTVAADRNGMRTLPTILQTFDPIDLVILMLGTNDMKLIFGGSAVASARGIDRMIEIVTTMPYESGAPAPKVIVVSPPVVTQLAPTPGFPLMATRSDKSRQLAALYRGVAERRGAAFLDAAEVATTDGGGDGVHLDDRNTRAIGEALAPLVRQVLQLPESASA